MLLAILLACVVFTIFLAAHVFIFHNYPPKRRFRTLIYLCLASLGIYTAFFFFIAPSGLGGRFYALIPARRVDLLGGIVFYFFIYFAYFHQVIVFDRSITPRIMIEIDQSPGRRLTKEELKKAYSLEDKIKRELADMVYMKRLSLKDGYYMNTKKGIAHARCMQFLRDYLHIGGHQ